jgi:hypothetical protein
VKFSHTPENGSLVDYEVEVDDLAEQEAEAIEEAGGAQWRTFAEWSNLLEAGGFRAWRVLLWTLQRRTNPDLDLNEVKLKSKELGFPPDQSVGKAKEGTTEPDDSDTGSTSPEQGSDLSPNN